MTWERALLPLHRSEIGEQRLDLRPREGEGRHFFTLMPDDDTLAERLFEIGQWIFFSSAVETAATWGWDSSAGADSVTAAAERLGDLPAAAVQASPRKLARPKPKAAGWARAGRVSASGNFLH